MNYYDEQFLWMAAHSFTDEHYGSAISEEELANRLMLLEDYKDEIAQAREILKNTPGFADLEYNAKIQYAANLISKLSHANEETVTKSK